MRAIKFRAWDIGTNRMRGWDWVRGNNYFDEGLPIMQFTGLFDKSGVEIYEGDIYTYSVFTGPENGKYECGYGPMVVEYRESICTETSNFLGIGFTIFSEDMGGIEVIGNIYEHGHLL